MLRAMLRYIYPAQVCAVHVSARCGRQASVSKKGLTDLSKTVPMTSCSVASCDAGGLQNQVDFDRIISCFSEVKAIDHSRLESW